VVGIDNDVRTHFFGPGASTAGTRDQFQASLKNYNHLTLDIRDSRQVPEAQSGLALPLRCPRDLRFRSGQADKFGFACCKRELAIRRFNYPIPPYCRYESRKERGHFERR
jgi:hypothetical protein